MNKAMININRVDNNFSRVNDIDIEKPDIKKIIINSSLSDNEIT